MNPTELKEILERHKKWLKYEDGGERADLGGAYLGGADLTGADLTGADLTGAYLGGADLTGAYLTGADLGGADLTGADLTGAYLTGAYLTGAYLGGADLTGADLTGADLRGADLRDAYLRDAYLEDAYLTGANLEDVKLPSSLSVPDLKSKILEQVTQDAACLNMGSWHSCGTTHCLAGWAIHLAGKEGYELEEEFGSHVAGVIIFQNSIGEVPDFYTDNKSAMAWLKGDSDND